MANKSSKIKSYLDDIKGKSSLELANAELLKIFGDEETYNRFILINYNKNMTSAFCARRADGLYVSMDMALRNFSMEMQARNMSDDYENFARFHNSTRFDYPVVQTAYDNFFMQEVAMFCCGALPSDGYYRRKGYYDQFRDSDSKLILTPQIVKIDTEHPNYKIVKDLTINRQKNLPLLFMDDKTLSAFTCFRVMVYNKTMQNLKNGVADRVSTSKFPQVYNRNNNPYLCYAVALQDTCEYFKTFYNPNQVQFTDTKLPYKGLGVMEAKVNDILSRYNIPTIGTIGHFGSSKKLPWILQDMGPITKVITKMVDFKGVWVNDDEYTKAFNKNRLIVNIQENQSVKVAKSAPVSTGSIKESTTIQNQIDEALEKTTRIIKGEYTYTYDKNIENAVLIVNSRLQKLSNIKINRTAEFLQKVLRETDLFNQKSQKQLPMFFEIPVGIERITVGNTIGFIDSQKFLPFVTTFSGVNKKYNQLVSEYKRIETLATSLNSISSEYAYAKRDYDNPPPLSPKQESEVYRWKDPKTGEFLSGSYELYELERCKNEYIKVYDELTVAIETVNQLSSEFAILLDEVTVNTQELLAEKMVDKNDLEGAVDIITELGEASVTTNVIDINS